MNKRKIFLVFLFLLLLILLLSWQLGLFSFLTFKKGEKEIRGSPRITAPFIKNEGQVDEKVSYYLKTLKMTAYFTKSGITFDFSLDADSRGQEAQRFVFSLTFEGANLDVEINGLEEQEGKISYFVGKDPTKWKTGIPTYAVLRYKNLYPGIDLEYDSRLGELKYKFIVKPGADYQSIQISYDGIDGLKINEDGDLVIQTAIGEILDKNPNTYQEINGQTIKIPGEFRLLDSVSFSFGIKNYSKDYPLIIGP